MSQPPIHLTEGSGVCVCGVGGWDPGDRLSHTLVGKEGWKRPGRRRGEPSLEKHGLLTRSQVLCALGLHELPCWLRFKWAAREISSNPEESRSLEALITDRLSHPAGLAGRLFGTPLGRSGGGGC